MKMRLLIIVLSIMLPVVTFLLLKWPLISIVEFEARGHFGDEIISISKNGESSTLLPETQVGKEWKKFSLETFGPLSNIRIHYLNAPKPTDPPRLLYIHSGIVKLYRKSLLGEVIVRKDILNIDSIYRGLNGQPLFDVDSIPMGSVRGGITGWTGYYELYP